MRKENEDIL